MRRGEVWIAELNPRMGTEPGKTRPVLIVQSQDLIDAGHPSSIVLPLTTNLIDGAEPLRIRVRAQGKLRGSDILTDQIRAIDNRRLVKGPLARISASTMKKIEGALREVLDLVEEG